MRGKIECWDCEDFAVYWDESPPKSASSCDFWCEKHCPEKPADGYERFRFKQELVKLEDGGEIYYPSFLINNEWKGWPVK